MSEEILINVTPQETRVAVVDNGVLQEIYLERSGNRGLVGNIYKGKVARILPGMQAAFIDVGLERTGFLHAGDIIQPELAEDPELKNCDSQTPISELLKEGGEILVQVLKDPVGQKGARLTTQITVPARLLVYLPNVNHLGVSHRIQDLDDRQRLLQELGKAIDDNVQTGGYIVRTAAESASNGDMRSDVEFLHRVWTRIQEKAQDAPICTLVHEDISLSMRVMRDLVRDDVEKLRIDSRETYEKALNFAKDLIPEVVDRIEYYPGERPIFELYSIEDEIRKALERDVPLKSGGYLVIDQTEAMTTVDVNTGAFVGRRNLEETLFKTNLEATQMIARQLRLRNIGGIIIVDFIDMEDSEHQRQVLRALEKALAKDRTKTFITEMSPLGLVEITRKRTRESLEQMLMEPCSVCSGRGVLKTPQTVCYEIFREILREARQFDTNQYTVVASQTVIDELLDEESTGLADLQEFIGKPISLKVETSYHQELFDVVLM